MKSRLILATMATFLVVIIFYSVFLNGYVMIFLYRHTGFSVCGDNEIEQISNSMKNGLYELYIGKQVPSRSKLISDNKSVYYSPGRNAKLFVDEHRTVVDVVVNEDDK